MHNRSIVQQLEDLKTGRYSAVELTSHYLERIKKLAPLNCYITVLEEQALAAAKSADEDRAGGRDSALLTGIPIAHKDIFCTRGVRTTAGSLMLDNFTAPYESTVVEKLHSAGAITIGKTNMDEFAMGSSNENSYFGAVRNPWDLSRVPGGSSGGSAAAVAAGLCSAATGTDTGGSIRQPSAHLRHHRIQTYLRSNIQMGDDRICVKSGPGRTNDPYRRRRRPVYWGLWQDGTNAILQV